MKILAVCGSPRPGGNTNYLVDVALRAADEAGASTSRLVLSEMNIKPCLAHEKCSTFKRCVQNDDICAALDSYLQAEGVILATPVYYFNMSAQMKMFIDRNYFLSVKRLHPKARTVGMIVVAESEGIEETVHTLTQFVDWTFRIPRANLFAVTGYAAKAGSIRDDDAVVESARDMGRNMVTALNLHTAGSLDTAEREKRG
jgi:multimeric flavodoxin WrbA